MQRSVKDALHCQDKEAKKEVQTASGGADSEKPPKGRDCLQDSIYWEARDQDSEPSDSEKETAQALSQVHIHSSVLESSVAPDTSEPKDG